MIRKSLFFPIVNITMCYCKIFTKTVYEPYLDEQLKMLRILLTI